MSIEKKRHYCGVYNTFSNKFPVRGGTGNEGKILEGDTWMTGTVAFTGPLKGIQLGTPISALVDEPGQEESNWKITVNDVIDLDNVNLPFLSVTTVSTAIRASQWTPSNQLRLFVPKMHEQFKTQAPKECAIEQKQQGILQQLWYDNHGTQIGAHSEIEWRDVPVVELDNMDDRFKAE